MGESKILVYGLEKRLCTNDFESSVELSLAWRCCLSQAWSFLSHINDGSNYKRSWKKVHKILQLSETVIGFD